MNDNASQISRSLVPVVVFVRAEGIDLGDAGHNGVLAVQEALDSKADRDQEWHQATVSGSYPGGGNELAEHEMVTNAHLGRPRKVQVVAVSTLSAALRNGALTITPTETIREQTT